MKIILATNNQGKIKELNEMLNNKYEILTMKEIGFFDEIEETGSTFKENAEIKAKTIYEFMKKENILKEDDIIISEDAGILIDAMPNELGIYSARFMGHETAYSIKNKEIIKRLNGLPREKRGCQYISNICLIKDHKINNFVGEIFGFIGEKPLGTNGFAFDPIFYIDENETMATITLEEKNEISHRSIAVAQMINFLNI